MNRTNALYLRLARASLALLIFTSVTLTAPRLWCGREAGALFAGELAMIQPLAAQVAAWVQDGVGEGDFHTGSDRFDGEWAFGSYHMAGLGLAQVIRQHPSLREQYLPAVETCIRRLTTPALRRFDTAAWGSDALHTLDGPQGHAAYLGYLNLLVGLYRTLDPLKFKALHRRVTLALARRLERSPIGLLATYPHEVYPVDNSAVISSIALYDQVSGADHGALLASTLKILQGRYVDPESGLLYQAVSAQTGAPLDRPRASGTALAAYFLSFADLGLSRDLYTALKRSCATTWLGFGLIREYPHNVPQGRGDIDSGPVVLGMSFSGTGFTMASSRIHGDLDHFRSLFRTAYLIGAPLDRGASRGFVCGGPLGNAILLAMFTAGRAP